jgi:hypothetical protein
MVKKCAVLKPKRRAFRVGKLESVANIAEFERRLLRSAARSAVGAGGGISVNDAYKLSSVCSQLVKAVEVSELEARVVSLEKKAGGVR